MQLVEHSDFSTVVMLSKRNITELYENMDNPDFNGLMKLQENLNDPALDARIVRVLVDRTV